MGIVFASAATEVGDNMAIAKNRLAVATVSIP